MEELDFRGHRVAYERTGRGPAMIFLHNGGSDHRIWDHQVAHFAATHEVFAVDLLGYGASDRPEIDYTLSLYVEMVEALVAYHRLASPVLVGNCMGSGIALGYATRHPDGVAALALCNVLTERTALAGAIRFAGRRSTVVSTFGTRLPRFLLCDQVGDLLLLRLVDQQG